jgi:hypothetical protein
VESKTLEDAIDDIMLAIETTLKAEINIDGGVLSDVKTLVIGESTSQKPTTPALWINQGLSRLVPDDNYIKTEMWQTEIIVISVIYSSDQYNGYKDANSLAARAKRVLLTDRTLGFGHGTFFSDIRSESFEGSNPQYRRGNIFSSVYTCKAYYTVYE